MRYAEIRRPAAPDSHPFVADITIAPAAFPGFERRMWDRPDVRLLCRVDRPGAVVVHVACASATARERLRDAQEPGHRGRSAALRGGGLDEAPMACRRVPDALARHAGTVRILRTLRPVGVGMGVAGREVRDPYKV